jgi:hypothetical protein
MLDVHARGEMLEYPAVFATADHAKIAPDFTNWRVSGGVFAEYRFTQTFGLNTTIDYVHQFSDTLLPAGGLPGNTFPAFFDQNYGRLTAFLGVRYFY